MEVTAAVGAAACKTPGADLAVVLEAVAAEPAVAASGPAENEPNDGSDRGTSEAAACAEAGTAVDAAGSTIASAGAATYVNAAGAASGCDVNATLADGAPTPKPPNPPAAIAVILKVAAIEVAAGAVVGAIDGATDVADGVLVAAAAVLLAPNKSPPNDTDGNDKGADVTAANGAIGPAPKVGAPVGKAPTPLSEVATAAAGAVVGVANTPTLLGAAAGAADSEAGS